MDLDGAAIKKKVRPGLIELAPDECAIIVNYEVESSVLGEHGEQMAVETTKAFKKIKVKTLTAKSDLQQLAEEVTDKCKLIHSSKVGQVHTLLKRLQDRETRQASGGYQDDADQRMLRQRLEAERYQEAQRKEAEAAERAAAENDAQNYYVDDLPPPSLDDLDDYLEKMYDELPDKVRATTQIAALAKNTENLEQLLMAGNVLAALSRTLREDGKKSIDLTINIVSVFFSFSHFSQFHPRIIEHQIGDLTMRLVDLELKRIDERLKEESGKQVTQRMVMMTRKQDRLLYVCLYLLLNLAEDVSIERKMKKRGIVSYLTKTLERRNVELLILSVTFLKKLSIYRENKDKMHECGLVARLAHFVPVPNEVLLNAVLRLLLNLSFDVDIRAEMVEAGLIQKVVELVRSPNFQNVCMALLYHISMDDGCKGMFTYTGIIPWLLECLLQVDDLHSAPELISLAVNLSQNARNATVMCEGQNFMRLINRAMVTKDPLLFKVIRNVSQQELKMKLKFKPFIEPLVQLLKAPDTTSELLVEVLGTIGNLNIPEFDFYYLVREHRLMEFLAAHLAPGEVDDDIMLEVVIMCGTLCNENTADLIVQAGLVESLFQLMSDKKEDDEMVLQISYTFYQLLVQEPTREALLRYTQVVFYLVDLLQDKNREVRRTADKALDVLVDADEEWAVKIRRMKFESYNQDWLAVVENDNAEYAEQYAQQQAMLYEQQGGDGYDVGSDEEEAFNRMYAQQQAMGYGVQGMYDGEEGDWENGDDEGYEEAYYGDANHQGYHQEYM